MPSAAERRREGSQTWNVWENGGDKFARWRRAENSVAPEAHTQKSWRVFNAHTKFYSLAFQTFHVWLPSARASGAGGDLEVIEMSTLFTKAIRALVFFLFALASLAHAQQNQQQQPPPKKKKLQASSNFAQYAGRDASNRLIAGGATRDVKVTDEAGAQSLKGQEAYDAGRYDEAVAAFKRVTELTPNSAKAFYQLGVAYETEGRNKEAVEAYKRAVALADRPEIKALSYYNLANVLAADKRPREAVEAYKQVIAIAPNEAVAHYNLGLAYAAAGQMKDAVESFRQAIKLKPDYAEANFNLGIAYGDLEQYREAADAFRRATQIKPDYAEAHFNLGLADLALGDRAGAQAEIKTLQSLKSPLAAKLQSLSD
jgi:tetratricopeptide (TPR) repeat protein